MSLQTDLIFVRALRSNSALLGQLPAGDVYNTAIALPDEAAANADVPYIIVAYDGLNNQDTTKDDDYEGNTDRVTIGITIAAETRAQLAELAIACRRTIANYFRMHVGDAATEDYELIPSAIALSAQPVQYDADKPCYWQVLTYQCETDNDLQ